MLEIIFRFVFKTYNQDPGDADIKDHMESKGQLEGVYWLKPSEHFKVDELSLKKDMFIELANAIRYYWVDAKIVGTPSILSIGASIDAANIVVDYFPYWSIILVDLRKTITNSFYGCSVPLFKCLLIRIDVWLPLLTFKMALLKYL